VCDNMGPNFWELSDQEFIVGYQWSGRQSLDTPLPNYNRPQKDPKDPLPLHISVVKEEVAAIFFEIFEMNIKPKHKF